jgi:pantoate--beta-alanine ligase
MRTTPAIPAPSADCTLAEPKAPVLSSLHPSMNSTPPAHPHSSKSKVPATASTAQSRPGHFRGVATVVAKLLIAAEPDRAFFGQKDAAQVAVLRRMVADLRFATEIVVCPIVREPDGLALSSRNIYLSPSERAQALVLSRAVRRIESLVASGERHANKLIEATLDLFAAEHAVRIDYIAVVDWATLLPVETAIPGTLFAVAAYVGPTRLIDNTILS